MTLPFFFWFGCAIVKPVRRGHNPALQWKNLSFDRLHFGGFCGKLSPIKKKGDFSWYFMLIRI